MQTEYIIMTASAHMPNSCWGIYRRVALVEVEKGVEPKMISERARGVVRIVRTWENLNVGTTDKCAYRRALAEAKTELAELEKDNTHTLATFAFVGSNAKNLGGFTRADIFYKDNNDIVIGPFEWLFDSRNSFPEETKTGTDQ